MGTAREEKQKTSIRVEPSAWKKLRIRAVQEGRPTGAILADAINLYCKLPIPKEGK